MKFHNTDDGPRPCRASKRECPLGGTHYSTQAEAQSAYEAAQSSLPQTESRSLPRTVTQVGVVPMAHGQYHGCTLPRESLSKHLDAMREELGPEQAALYEANKASRDRGYHYHMTVVSPPELKQVKQEGRELTPFPKSSPVTYEGVGRVSDGKSEAYFVVCSSPSLDEWRAANGLSPKDFHVTLGFSPKDVHGKGKGEDTIFLK